MPRPKKIVQDFRAMRVSADEAAAFLRLSRRTFYRMVEAGTLPREQEGVYVLGDVWDAHVEEGRRQSGLLAARIRLINAKAELAEIDLEKAKDELLPAEAVEKVWNQELQETRTVFMSLPEKIAPRLVGLELPEIQTALKAAIYESLRQRAGRLTPE